MAKYTTYSRKETYELGRGIAQSLKGGEVLAFYGELGAGKTTFITGLVNYFLPGRRVLSPTFIIVRHYHPENKMINYLVHADLYRLNNINEIEDLGLAEYINQPKSVVLIEWADRMKNLLPAKRIDIFFDIIDENRRKVKVVP